MIPTPVLNDMLVITINSITEELTDYSPSKVSKLLGSYRSLLVNINKSDFLEVKSCLKINKDYPAIIAQKLNERDVINATYGGHPSQDERIKEIVEEIEHRKSRLDFRRRWLAENKNMVEIFNTVNANTLFLVNLLGSQTVLYFKDLEENNIDLSTKRLRLIEDLQRLLEHLKMELNINIDR